MDVEFRKAAPGDVLGIFAVETHCFAKPWSLDSIRDDVNRPDDSLYTVAESSGHIIGFCGMRIILDEGHIMNMAVLEEYRGQDIGRRLLKTMFDLAPVYVTRYTLEVRVSNIPAIRLYKRFGFVSLGIRPGYYADNDEDALIMWLEKNTP